MKELISHLEELEKEFQDLEVQLSKPEIASDHERYRKIAKKHSDLKKIIDNYEKFKNLKQKMEEADQLVDDDDPEIAELAQVEKETVSEEMEDLKQKIEIQLLPKDPDDEKNIIVEIRAGTGGEEAALFASDLFRAYTRYAENQGWKIDIMEKHQSELGGFKEIIFSIEGGDVYSRMKYESGTHRVQRVPETETGGRIHTSAVTVAVLPEAEDVEVNIRPEDLRIDVFRSTGPGGQSVNTTDSAVRITHVPTDLVVTCQDEKSQHKNKAKALKVLRARLYEKEIQRQKKEISDARRQQVGTGDRSERIRTYNFPQNRVTDHRINLTLYRLESILEGDLDELIQNLIQEDQIEKLKSLTV